jgi:hypothetical protein
LYVDSLGFNNVFKLNQTITFGALPAKHVGDPAFDLTASSSSGYPISYTSSNLDVATMISGSTLSIVGAGTSDITASQIGDDYYNPATPVVRTLTVLPGTGIDAVTSEMVRIYPNPASGTIFIQSNILMNNISILDMLGRTMNQYQPNSVNEKVDISHLANGIYFVKIQCGDREYLRKIEKK